MKKAILCLLVLVLFFSCTKEETDPVAESQEYEFLFPFRGVGGSRAAYWERHDKEYVITYFKNVALGTENGNSFPVTLKWASDMNIFMGGNPSDGMLSELNLIKEEINTYATDGFSMNIVNDSLQSNYYLFFGSPQVFKNIFPEQIININENYYGLFHVNWNEKFEITNGYMFVNNESGESQKHILREELTQSLGLPNDIGHRDSIFYFELSTVTSYNKWDKEIIRLLYHPKMISGFGSRGVDSMLRGILGLPRTQ